MNIIVVILIASIILQFSAAVIAFQIIRQVTGLKYFWFFTTGALFLMCIRRVIPLYDVITQNSTINIYNEVIGLILSLFMLIGIIGIKRVFIERNQFEEKHKFLFEKMIHGIVYHNKKGLFVK